MKSHVSRVLAGRPAVSAVAEAAGAMGRAHRSPAAANGKRQFVPEHAVRAAEGVTADLGSGRVLIVDDDVDAADTLADLLRLDGYDTEVSYGEQHAVERARTKPFDVVILDIAMPDRGGHWLAGQLRALLPDALLIAFTGFSGSQDIERSMQAGIDEHWVKPMSAASFSLALTAARQRRSRR